MRQLASSRLRPGSSPRRWMAGVVLLVVGCLSPTMPLPPPAKPDIDGPDAAGMVVLSGRILGASQIYVDNESSGYSAGQILNPETGAYRFGIQASVGDFLSLFYRKNSELSQARVFEILATSGGATSGGATSGGAASGGATSGGATGLSQ